MAIKGFARELLPYVLNRHKDGTWSLSNRNYKRISFTGADECHRFKLRAMTDKKLATVAWNGVVGEDGVFLYNDGTHPMTNKKLRDEYLARLGILIAASVSD